MPGAGGLLLLENLFQFVGAFVTLSVAYVALRGYRLTGSSTLLRLSLAFSLLCIGFLLAGTTGLMSTSLESSLAVAISVLLLVGASLQTLGYFFLAFSHILDVISAKRLGFLSVVGAGFVTSILNSVSIYFLLYGVVETTLSYVRMKKNETLLIALGLGLIVAGEFLKWMSYFPPESPLYLASIVTKLAGISLLFVPVLRFSLKGRGIAET